MKKFTLVDGSGLLFRSYYGLPQLNDASGEAMQMVYGMAKMTLKLLLDKPDFFAIARDVGGKTIRHEMDENYKANRVKAPDDLIQQIHLSHQMISDLRLPAFGFAGYEADDVINTFVQQAKNTHGLHTTIISSDKDLKQLITESVDMYDPMKNKTTNYLNFSEKYSFKPAQLLEYLALIGDSSDNIPGVPGIGPKSASDLILHYNTVQGIYDNIEKIPGSLQKKLIQGKNAAFHSRTMVELIVVEEMHHLSLDHYCVVDLDFNIIRHVLLDQYGFHSLSKNIDAVEHAYSKVSMQGLFG